MGILLYHQVYEKLSERITSGVYPRGTPLPSENKLRGEFGVSQITIRRAIHELALDGLVVTRQGVGSFVREKARDGVVIGLSNFTSSVAAGRLRLVRTLLTDETIPASVKVADRLGVQRGSMVRHLVRLDMEGRAPVSIDEVFVPPALARRVDAKMAASPLFMHLWQQRTGMKLIRTQYEIAVEKAGRNDQGLLQIGPEVPLLVTGELVLDSAERVAMWIVTRYRADRCRLSGSVLLIQKRTKHGTIGE
jgi:GntR family transcriptional regulator